MYILRLFHPRCCAAIYSSPRCHVPESISTSSNADIEKKHGPSHAVLENLLVFYNEYGVRGTYLVFASEFCTCNGYIGWVDAHNAASLE